LRPLRLAALWKLIGWVMVAFVVVASLIPPPAEIPFNLSDKFMHLLTYGALALWFGAIYRRERFARIGLMLIALGVLLEFAQGLTRTRSFEFADMVADGLGTLAGLLAAATPVGGLLLLVEKRLPAGG
jgi:VanZ family protein